MAALLTFVVIERRPRRSAQDVHSNANVKIISRIARTGGGKIYRRFAQRVRRRCNNGALLRLWPRSAGKTLQNRLFCRIIEKRAYRHGRDGSSERDLGRAPWRR